MVGYQESRYVHTKRNAIRYQVYSRFLDYPKTRLADISLNPLLRDDEVVSTLSGNLKNESQPERFSQLATCLFKITDRV